MLNVSPQFSQKQKQKRRRWITLGNSSILNLTKPTFLDRYGAPNDEIFFSMAEFFFLEFLKICLFLSFFFLQNSRKTQKKFWTSVSIFFFCKAALVERFIKVLEKRRYLYFISMQVFLDFYNFLVEWHDL